MSRASKSNRVSKIVIKSSKIFTFFFLINSDIGLPQSGSLDGPLVLNCSISTSGYHSVCNNKNKLKYV